MSKIPILHSIRLIPQEDSFINRRSGSKGEIFYNKDSDSLTLFNGSQQGGIDIARSDLTNISDASFLSKASAAGLGNTTVSVSESTPQDAAEGNLWLNTSNNQLNVYVNDQWIVTSFSGSYNDLTDKPSLFSGSYNDLTDKPSLFSGSYTDLTNKPTLATVATSGDYDDLTNTPTIPSILTDLGITDGTVGQVLTTDGNGDFTFEDPVGASIGSFAFVGTNIDSTDSSAISITPAVVMLSDLTVQNDLIVSNVIQTKSASVDNDLTVKNIILEGNLSTQGSGTPEIVSDNEINLDAGSRVDVIRGPIRMARFTSAERDLLVAQNGDMIYNTTTNKFQGYENGSWANLI